MFYDEPELEKSTKDKLKEKRRVGDERNIHRELVCGDLMGMFDKTFNSRQGAYRPFDSMVANYDKMFEEERSMLLEETQKRLAQRKMFDLEM